MKRSFAVSRPAALLCLLLGCLASTVGAAVRIDPARTWVGLARVHLTVTDVRLTHGGLDAAYSIRVPFWPGGDDKGTLRLHSTRPIDELHRSGGTLAGTARSASGETRAVTCRIQPGGKLRIDIAMDERTISFDTRYEMSGQL